MSSSSAITQNTLLLGVISSYTNFLTDLLVSYCKPSQNVIVESFVEQGYCNYLFLFSRESASTSVISAQVSTVAIMEIHMYMSRQ